MPPILGVAEVVLNVTDLPKMRSFYQDVLGFELVDEGNYEELPDPNGKPTITFLEIQPSDTPLGRHGHPVLLALIDHSRHDAAKRRFRNLQIAHSTLNHLAFEILPDSYDEHFSRLEQLGLKPEAREFPRMQARAMFFRDPEGNTLELICHQGV